MPMILLWTHTKLAHKNKLIWVRFDLSDSLKSEISVSLSLSETEISDHQEVHILLYVINDLSEKLHNQPSILMIDCLCPLFHVVKKKIEAANQETYMFRLSDSDWDEWAVVSRELSGWPAHGHACTGTCFACPWACRTHLTYYSNQWRNPTQWLK